MNEGERIAATFIGVVIFLAAFIGLGNALWYQSGSEAVLLGTIAVMSGWLARVAFCGLDD